MTPVTVVLGLPGAGKSTWIERELAGRPADARWAVLGPAAPPGSAPGPGGPVPGGPRGVPGRPSTGPGLLRQPLGPGCACCALRPALARSLTQLLRAGPWDRLILEADGAAHPERLVAVLREAPFAAAQRIDAIVLVVDGRQIEAWQAAISGAASARSHDDRPTLPVAPPPVRDPATSAGGRLPAASDDRRLALIGAASQVVINRPSPGAGALAATLAAAGPFGRSVTVEDSGEAPRVWAPPAARTLARWPTNPLFDRRALQAVLADWAARHPALPVRGAWPTARAWYAWDSAPGVPARWEVSDYCLEGRLDTATSYPDEPPGRVPDDAAAYASLVAAIDRLRDAPVSGATGSGTPLAAP